MSELHGGWGVTWLALHDKVVHFGLYAVLGGALAWGQHRSPFPAPHALVLLAGFGYGAVDEWHQSFVPNRIPAVDDFVADVVGVVAGYLLLVLLWQVVRRLRSESSSNASY